MTKKFDIKDIFMTDPHKFLKNPFLVKEDGSISLMMKNSKTVGLVKKAVKIAKN